MHMVLSNAITDFLQAAAAGVPEGAEWSIVMDHHYTKEVFDNIVMYLRSAEFQERYHDDTLTVTTEDSFQLRVSGASDISRYCYSESPDTISSKKFGRSVVMSDETLPNELSIKMRSVVRQYTVVDTLNADTDTWTTIPKQYQIEKVIDYIQPKQSIVYRLKIVKAAAEPAPSMVLSGVSTARPVYQIEVLVTSKTIQIEDVVRRCIAIVQLSSGQRFPLSLQQQADILSEYDKLVSPVLTGRNFSDDDPHFFLAPKPITLESCNVVEPGPQTYGVTSVFQDYTVTDKADGERILLYVRADGHAFFINNTYDVCYSGVQAKDKSVCNTLIDGEFVPAHTRRDNIDKDVFAAFDIYFLNGKSVMNKPLITGSVDCRYALLKDAMAKTKWISQTQTELRCKNIIAADGQDMRDACRSILRGATKLPYTIDGLIFTPKDLAVFAYYPGRPVDITRRMRWDKVFKWKPPEQNTIDFLVEFTGKVVTDVSTKKRYQAVRLFTGYSAKQWEPISPLEGVRLRYDAKYFKQYRARNDIYKPKLFQPVSNFEPGVDTAYLEIDANGMVASHDGSIIDRQTIVEFGYSPDPSIEISKRWVPLRVRVDKTRVYEKSGRSKINKTANDLTVALSIWRSIHDPVTEEMLTEVKTSMSKVPDTLEERLLGTDDVYYARDMARHHMLSVHMLNFHNQGIKKMLYQMSRKKDSLLELACGRAGDMPRWRDGGYRFILGVDLVRDNITKPDDGAYARMLQQKRAVTVMNNGVEETIYPDVVFAVGDCALPLYNGQAAEGMDAESAHLLRVMYKGDGKVESHMKYIVGRAARGFSVVSCQFAIHYFFKNETTLAGFLDNISYNLKKGGLFVATFMDGQTVDTMLSEAKDGIVEGRKLDGKVPVWAIIKRYTTYTDNDNDYLGKHVDVYLENTRKTIPEFLVNFDMLVAKAKEYGLELEDTAMFSQNFAMLQSQVPKDKRRRTKLHDDILALANDPVQTRFSFLNRWVVFRKQ